MKIGFLMTVAARQNRSCYTVAASEHCLCLRYERKISAIRVDCSFRRPNSFRSRNGAVLEIRGADAAALYYRTHEQCHSPLLEFGIEEMLPEFLECIPLRIVWLIND